MAAKAMTSSDEEYFINKQNAINIEAESYLRSYHSYEPINKLKNAVIFTEDDIIEFLSKNTTNEKSVLMLRNVTPYLPISKQENLFNTVKTFLTKGSLLVIGNFDAEAKFKTILDKDVFNRENFIKIGKNIYKRI